MQGGWAGVPTGSWSNKAFLTWGSAVTCCSTFACLAAHIGQMLVITLLTTSQFWTLTPHLLSNLARTFFFVSEVHFKMVIFAFEMFWL